MKFFIKCLVVVILGMSFTMSFAVRASTDPCFAPGKQHASQCNDYQYDKLNTYFLDTVSTEQQVLISRVKSRATGQLMYAHYDFVIKCAVNCAISEADILQDALWAFRNALLENRLYEKIQLPCEPTEEICCDNSSCQQIDKVDDTNVAQERHVLQEGAQSIQRKKGSSQGKEVARALHNADAAVNLYQNLARDSSNAADFQHRHTTQLHQPSLFSLLKVTEGFYKVMRLVAENTYEAADGTVRHDPDQNLFYADIENNWGGRSNSHLHNFLINAFYLPDNFNCSHSTQSNNEATMRSSINISCK